MVKKVRFNDNVQINRMSINLSEHVKEVKLAKDIIINPENSTLRRSDTEIPPHVVSDEATFPTSTDIPNAKNYKWWIGLVIIIFIVVVFLAWKYYKSRINKGDD